jgi:HEAT repeat protein
MTVDRREVIRPRWSVSRPPDVHPHDSVLFADLAGVAFHDADLHDVTFFGCRLNGADFVGANLSGVRFIGCFAADHGDPVVFGSEQPALVLVHTHLGHGDRPDAPAARWPVHVADAAWRCIAGDNLERYRAVQAIGESGYAPAAPFLASLLDDEEWDVRSAILQALQALRGNGFPDGDEPILRAASEALGDENSLVSMQAVELVQQAGAPSGPLAYVVGKTRSAHIDEVLVGLRAVVALSRAGDLGGVVAATVNCPELLGLLQSPVAAIRAEYLHALGAANLNIEQAWAQGLRDPDPGVRARAVSALRLLDEPPPADLVEPLIHDPAEAVRIEALFTLGQLGDFDRAVVSAALTDPSEEVRRYAAMLLQE